MELRVGLGFDSHPLKVKKNNTIMIGGIPVKCNFAVEATSDGDVVLHAISDALLGASGLGDIGMYYSPSDINNKDLDSIKIMNHVLKMVSKKYQVVNIDINIIVEDIKIDPIRYILSENLQKILKTKNVNIKAKHYEEPKKEISSQVVVLLSKKA